MLRKLRLSGFVLLVLLAAGIVDQLYSDPSWVVLPVLVLGVIFLLYKFPPTRWGANKVQTRSVRKSAADSRSRSKAKSSKTRKQVPFRVIDGGKDDDNVPKYH